MIKKVQRSKDPFQVRFRQHVETSIKRNEALSQRDDWARQGLAMSENGDRKGALAAQKKALAWDAKAKRLEARLQKLAS